jgi:hypothetical protein
VVPSGITKSADASDSRISRNYSDDGAVVGVSTVPTAVNAATSR